MNVDPPAIPDRIYIYIYTRIYMHIYMYMARERSLRAISPYVPYNDWYSRAFAFSPGASTPVAFVKPAAGIFLVSHPSLSIIFQAQRVSTLLNPQPRARCASPFPRLWHYSGAGATWTGSQRSRLFYRFTRCISVSRSSGHEINDPRRFGVTGRDKEIPSEQTFQQFFGGTYRFGF